MPWASQYQDNTLAVPIHVALPQPATDDAWRDHLPLKPEPLHYEDERNKDQHEQGGSTAPPTMAGPLAASDVLFKKRLCWGQTVLGIATRST